MLSKSFPGEKLSIPLYCETYTVPVYLDPHTVEMDDCFIGLHTQKSIRIMNASNTIVNFRWSPFKDEEEEETAKDSLLLLAANRIAEVDEDRRVKLATWLRSFSQQTLVSCSMKVLLLLLLLIQNITSGKSFCLVYMILLQYVRISLTVLKISIRLYHHLNKSLLSRLLDEACSFPIFLRNIIENCNFIIISGFLA